MSSAAHRGWGEPGTPGSKTAAAYRSANIVRLDVAGVGSPLYVHREVAHLFRGFLVELLASGYDIDDYQDDWGYNCRCQRGTGPGTGRACKMSNHSWGLAIDVNAVKNPMRRPFTSDMPAWINNHAKRWHLGWGGTWNTPDPMHFEYVGLRSQVPVGANPAYAPPARVRPAAVAVTDSPRPVPNNPPEEWFDMAVLYDLADDSDGDGKREGGIFVSDGIITRHVPTPDILNHLVNTKMARWLDGALGSRIPNTVHNWLVENSEGEHIPEKV